MTVYPFEIDSDANLPPVNDNITETGGELLNQIRESLFAIETELGIHPAGSAGSVSARLNRSFNADGYIRASALTSVGLATLPIVDTHVASNAGIKEYKLSLDHSTTNLYTLISSNTTLLNSLIGFTNSILSDLTTHVSGNLSLSNNDPARHVLSQIDLNSIPQDARDVNYAWSGLKDKTGTLRPATQAAAALDQINTDLITHETTASAAHAAAAITVDTSALIEIPETANTVQKTIEYLDQAEMLNIGLHRATQHANGIPRTARSHSLLEERHNLNVVPMTSVKSFLVHALNTTPIDDLSIGDDVIKFFPIDNSNFVFDSQFSQVRVGDILTIDYGNSIETSFLIDSLRYLPGAEWVVRVNGTNLFDTDGYALARIDRPHFDTVTFGILAAAAADAVPISSFPTLMPSLIIGHPRGATARGLGFDAGKLDNSHYQLYMELYPTGNPIEHIIKLPSIDITGNAGATPGRYTLDSIVRETNKAFRNIGFNYRFIAIAQDGDFGLMLADAISNVGFAILNSDVNNVVGADGLDALGFGPLAANLASPPYQNNFSDTTAAQTPTKVILPLKHRDYVVNGQRKDSFVPTYGAIGDGYWPATLTARTPISTFTVEVTYTIDLDLRAAGLRAGKTLVVQPVLTITDAKYKDLDYGRFIIKSVSFSDPCNNIGWQTHITIINGLHATGVGFGFSTEPPLPVKLYFSADSVSFNTEEIIDQVATTVQYSRLHEIYITQNGSTFAHERARLPKQLENAVPSGLGTANWHLRELSPKLRGYRDSSNTNLNKFIRLYILTYNNTSGEFTGYIGQRLSAGSTAIQRTGLVSTGRKNVPVRFYDETGIDYLEVIFDEVTASPGIPILSSATPRFIDIEIFPSLALDEEVLLLANCELAWNSVVNKNVIEQVTNVRTFGSISEKQFTNSALDYIAASDSFTQENGVVRGLDFDSINPADNRQLFFKGGVAIVNGKVVPINNSSVVIPNVYPFGTTLPQTMTWAICANRFGELLPIVITTSGTQFFATTGSNNYYLPSVTFNELVSIRKDLVLIAIVTAHIASFTITNSDVKDMRKFVNNQNQDQFILVSADVSYGNFHSVETAVNWVNALNNLNNKIIVRGNFTFSSSLDLTKINKKTIFEGDLSAHFIFNCTQGLLLGSNVTLKNINFTYNPTGLSFAAGDTINTGNGCIYSSSSDLIDVTIEDCIFNYQNTTQRPPFINLEVRSNQIVSNLRIQGNRFIDNTPLSTAGKRQAAIAIIFTNGGSSVNPALITDSIISGNVTNYDQGIYITTVLSSSHTLPRPGINCSCTRIANNTCGVIGFITSSVANTNITSGNGHISFGLSVNDNSCHYIASLYSNGKHITVLNPPYSYGFGQTIVKNNFTNWIHVTAQDLISNQELSALLITENNLLGYDPVYLSSFFNGDNSLNFAILALDYSAFSHVGTSKVSNNNIQSGSIGNTTYTYFGGIWCLGSGIITGNVIRGIALANPGSAVDGVGIIAKQSGVHPDLTPTLRNYIITNNAIYRDNNLFNSYISSGDANQLSSAMVTNNFFDKITTDNVNSLLSVNPRTAAWTAENNINQTVLLEVNSWSGRVTLNDLATGDPSLNSLIEIREDGQSTALDRTIKFTYNDTTILQSVRWRINLNDILPRNVQVISVSTKINSSTTPSNVGTTLLKLQNTGVAEEVFGNLDGSDHTLTLTPTEVFRNTATLPTFILTQALVNSTGTVVVYIDRLLITYRW